VSQHIEILSTTALKSTLDALGPQLETGTARTLAIRYMPSARIMEHARGGDRFDIALATREVAQVLESEGWLAAGAVVPIARAAVGLAVRPDAPTPNISSADDFRQTLLNATAIAMSDPDGGGQSGRELMSVFERLGVVKAIRPKLRFSKGGPEGLTGYALLRGDADLALQQMPELLSVSGIAVVGPLPAALRIDTWFVAGLSARLRDPAARTLVTLLNNAAARDVLEAKGFSVEAE